MKEYRCINSIQFKAARFFLGVGRYTPNSGVLGDVGWDPVLDKQWQSVLCQWSRMRTMSEHRLNYKSVMLSEASGLVRNCKNWNYRIRNRLTEADIDLQQMGNNSRNIVTVVYNSVINNCRTKWINDVRRENARQGAEKNKLRLYKCFKSEYKTENYVKCMLPREHRSAYSKFRCGVAPIRIETGRYERLALEDRRCFSCLNQVEDEEHALLHCPLYQEMRQMFFEKYTSA